MDPSFPADLKNLVLNIIKFKLNPTNHMSVNYCTWRKDGPKTEGYSHELIPDAFIKHFKSETSTEDNM